MHRLLQQATGYDLGGTCEHHQLPEVVEAAEAAVAALLESCQVREEWGYELVYPAGRYPTMDNTEDVRLVRWVGSEEEDRRSAAVVAQSSARWQPPGPPGSVIHRFVITTPAEVVPPKQDPADG